jgi:hypothetical protein
MVQFGLEGFGAARLGRFRMVQFGLGLFRIVSLLFVV